MAKTNVVQRAADIGRPRSEKRARRAFEKGTRKERGRKSLAPPEGEAKKIGDGRGDLPLG